MLWFQLNSLYCTQYLCVPLFATHTTIFILLTQQFAILLTMEIFKLWLFSSHAKQLYTRLTELLILFAWFVFAFYMVSLIMVLKVEHTKHSLFDNSIATIFMFVHHVDSACDCIRLRSVLVIYLFHTPSDVVVGLLIISLMYVIIIKLVIIIFNVKRY